MKQSILDDIEGIGEKRKSLLLKKFTSINKIKEASVEELTKVVGSKTALNVYEYFRKEKKDD